MRILAVGPIRYVERHIVGARDDNRGQTRGGEGKQLMWRRDTRILRTCQLRYRVLEDRSGVQVGNEPRQRGQKGAKRAPCSEIGGPSIRNIKWTRTAGCVGWERSLLFHAHCRPTSKKAFLLLLNQDFAAQQRLSGSRPPRL